MLFFRVIALLLPLSAFCIVSIDAMRILAIETVPGKSHWNFMNAVLRALTDVGHSVTAFTPFPEGERANYTEVDIAASMPIKVAMNAMETIPLFSNLQLVLPLITNMTRDFCRIIYDNPQMREILQRGDNGDFDIVITEIITSECVSYVAVMLNVPIIYLIPSPMITYMERTLFGHSSNPATVSHLMGRHAVPNTFARRFNNVILYAYSTYIMMRKNAELRAKDPQPYDLVEPLKPSLVFTNTHFISEAARPIPPNVVEVGGIHLKRPKSIPTDILEFIETSPHGVIYFTFGSVISMSTLPVHIHDAFKEVLGQMPQRILWKYEGEMKNKPKNVMTSKWFPQRDILLHPKVKLFISHGGISSMYEAVDAGVPVLGFPLFYDQPRNIDNLVEAGMGISMDLLTMEKELLLKNILELINNDKYSRNAKIASNVFKDRPMSSSQSIVYWTEYVIRHKGAPQLKSHALNLTWYQYYLLDVMAVLLAIIAVTFCVAYNILKFIYKYFSKSSHNGKTKSE